ncbi:MAG: hypothetical protein EOP09_06135 [Proteobacteria bacterium]|nr:MAG: hypothetical protein EOP09_06135 [Pseudomonadota bacterium]
MSLQTFRSTPEFTWFDLSNPKRESFKNITEHFPLTDSDIEDCMNPRHLPKRENRGLSGFQFMLLRVYDPSAKPTASNTHQLTRKFALYFNDTKLLTVHRAEFKAVDELAKQGSCKTPHETISSLLAWAIGSYVSPLEDAQTQFEGLEEAAFNAPGAKKYKIRSAYLLRRRLFVIKRMLRLTRDILGSGGYEKELFETTEQLLFYAEELHESLTQLMQLQLSIVSQDTNESSLKLNDSMKILTVFSALFLPLNFIAGVYGMNFEWMPELKWKYGYPVTLTLMAGVAFLTWLGFKKSHIVETPKKPQTPLPAKKATGPATPR